MISLNQLILRIHIFSFKRHLHYGIKLIQHIFIYWKQDYGLSKKNVSLSLMIKIHREEY